MNGELEHLSHARKIVLIAYKDSLPSSLDSPPTVHTVTLRHPKTDEAALFSIIDDKQQIYELVTFKEKYRSWLIDSTIQQDGSLHLMTQVDPLFLILPYLMKNCNRKYMQLDQILDDEEHDDIRRLSSWNPSYLDQIANVKDAGDLVVYQYDEQKTVAWLDKKVRRLVEFLKSRGINVGRGAKSTNYIRGQNCESHSEVDYTTYACGIISDYITPALGVKLMKHLGIEIPVENSPVGPPAKKSKTDPSPAAPLEDYSLNFKIEKNEKVSKLTAGQKKLQAVDKSGMKSLSCFFSAKRKT